MVNEPQNTFLSISLPSFSLPFESPSMIIQLIPRFRGFPPHSPTAVVLFRHTRRNCGVPLSNSLGTFAEGSQQWT